MAWSKPCAKGRRSAGAGFAAFAAAAAAFRGGGRTTGLEGARVFVSAACVRHRRLLAGNLGPTGFRSTVAPSTTDGHIWAHHPLFGCHPLVSHPGIFPLNVRAALAPLWSWGSTIFVVVVWMTWPLLLMCTPQNPTFSLGVVGASWQIHGDRCQPPPPFPSGMAVVYHRCRYRCLELWFPFVSPVGVFCASVST